MTTTTPTLQNAAELRPATGLQRLMTGVWISHAISFVAKLGLADMLTSGPRSSAELAPMTGTHASSLYRVLRALASVGVFREDETGRFCLTPLADPLRSDVPGSLRPFAIMLGEEWHWRAWGDLEHTMRTGQSAFEHLYGMTPFEFWAQQPAAAAIFDQAMTSRSADENLAVVSAYNFSNVRTLVDVGGGHGSLLVSILQAKPGVRGILFDLPHVVAGAKPQVEAAGLFDRCELIAGDFFQSIAGGADACILKKIIHDWDDERALAILRNCHRAMPAGGQLLLVELVVPPGSEPSLAKLFDLLMLVWTPGGRERTEAEHRALLGQAGFEVTDVIPTAAPVSVIEAVRR